MARYFRNKMTKPSQVSSGQSLVKVLLERALRTPEQNAYIFLNEDGQEASRLDYGRLHAAVARTAAKLAGTASRGERVLLLLPPGQTYVVSFYACLLAGMVAVPVFATTSKRRFQRLRAVIEDCQASVIITTPELRLRLSLAFESFASADSFRWLEVCEDEGTEWPDDHGRWSLPAESELAFLQYTSGSTGSPKGVMVSHGNLWANSAAIQAAYDLGSQSTMMSWLPPYHDMGLIGGILQPLFCGCPAVLMAPESFMQKPLRWLEAISVYRATISGGPNFAYELCVRSVRDEEISSLDLGTWTEAYSGAEPIRASTVNAFCEKFRRAGLQRSFYFPCYGLAESTLIVSGGPSKSGPFELTVDRDHLASHRQALPLDALSGSQATDQGLCLVSSGVPVKDALVVIADETGVALQDGHVGEICVHGPSVAQGYWRNEAATQKAFAAEVDAWPGLRFLRTGDLGFLQDGRLYVTGRSKDLIIVRGRNLYPHDLEDTASASHPALRPQACAAFSLDTDEGEGVAFVMELQRHAKVTIDEIVSAVRMALAEQHQVQPAAIVLVRAGSLPLTSSGKLQRTECRRRFLCDELDALGRDDTPSRLDAVPRVLEAHSIASGDVLRWLQETVAFALRVSPERVAPRQSLAALGMDSLAAVSVTAAVADRFQVELSFSSLLGDACVQSLAEAIEKAVTNGPAATARMAAAVDEHPIEAVASLGQQGLWFLNRLTPEGSSYNVSLAACLPADTDLDALERALVHVVSRHDALRTNFFVRDGVVMQRVRADARFTLERVPAHRPEEAKLFDEHLAAEVQRPFDLGQDLLLRACVHDRGDGWVLQFVVHHIVVDFWSLVVLMHELTQFYRQERGGPAAEVKAQPHSYLAYANWQAGQQDSARYQSSGAWWRTQLAEPLPILNLPVDKARQPVLSERGASIAFDIDASLSEQVKALAHRKGVTLYNVLLAAYYVLLHRMSGQDDLIVGTPTAGRPRREHEDLIGYFVSSVPLRMQLNGAWGFETLLEQTAGLANESFQHAHYPFARIVADQLGERDTSRHPVFQTMFALQKAHRLEEAGVAPFVLGERSARFEAGGLRLESYPIEVRSCPFDLWLMMAESEGRLLGSLQYNTDLFLPRTVEHMVSMFKAILAGVLAEPARAVARLPLFGPREDAGHGDTVGSPRLPTFSVSCDHIPRRSWALFRARDVMRGVIESFKAEQAA